MIKNSSVTSFRSLYLQTHEELTKALKGEEYNPDKLDLKKIYQLTDDFSDEVRASLYSKMVNPEPILKKVYYEVICFYLLQYKELHINYRMSHFGTILFNTVARCFEQLRNLAEEIKQLAEAEGIKLRRFSDLNLQRDYALGGTYGGDANSRITDSPVPQQPEEEKKGKLTANYYALYHWILIEMGEEKNFHRDENDKFPKAKIEAFAKERYPQIGKQAFYRQFKGIDITKKIAIAITFGKGYKKKLIKLSNNDAKFMAHIGKYPN